MIFTLQALNLIFNHFQKSTAIDQNNFQNLGASVKFVDGVNQNSSKSTELRTISLSVKNE